MCFELLKPEKVEQRIKRGVKHIKNNAAEIGRLRLENQQLKEDKRRVEVELEEHKFKIQELKSYLMENF